MSQQRLFCLLRQCRTFRAVPWILLVATTVFLWCHHLSNHPKSSESPRFSRVLWPRFQEFNLTNLSHLSWIYEIQNEKALAFDSSRRSWPFPSKWRPIMEFQEPIIFNEEDDFPRIKPDTDQLWLFCSGQNQDCACYGTIRWGVPNDWVIIQPAIPSVASRIHCKVGKQPGVPELKDMKPGDDKHCECRVNTSTKFFQYVNMALLPKEIREPLSPEEVTNCPKSEADASFAGRQLWRGLQGVCEENWTEVSAGSKAMTNKQMRRAIKSYVVWKFAANYKRLYQRGWLRRAFVTYFAGALEGSESEAAELLIESVHRFSVYPIVVLLGSIAAPLHWNSKVFPRLVLLDMAQLPDMVGPRSSLLAASVMSHVETGVLLPPDSFVFPGIDHLFSTTEREVNAEYPYPLPQVHYLNKVHQNETYQKFSCNPRQGCILSMRWNQLGLMSWSLHALPFLGESLRALLRDEKFQAKAPRESLRVRHTVYLETFLNVALWRVNAFKQYCKVYLSQEDAQRWLDLNNSDCAGGMVCDPVTNDTIFYPEGIPRVVLSSQIRDVKGAGRALLMDVEERYRRGDLPEPILYYQKMYRSESDLRKDWPKITCLLGL